MHTWLRPARMACLAWIALPGFAADDSGLINPRDPSVGWRAYMSVGTCVLAGTAISEKRDDAFEVQFRRSRGQKLAFHVLIPGLRSGGSVFIESPTTRDRWKVVTDNFHPALDGARAEAIHRNTVSGIPIAFSFEFPGTRRVIYETAPINAVDGAIEFGKCIEFIERPLQAEKASVKDQR
jgi:hypothetical protein